MIAAAILKIKGGMLSLSLKPIFLKGTRSKIDDNIGLIIYEISKKPNLKPKINYYENRS